MSGHSKWATIKRAKASTDAKRGAIFTKLAKLITVAAKEKGGNLDTNFNLRMVVEKARAANMPKDNIEKAIKRGTGELEGGQIKELYYEGIGPANSQFIVKVLTDNKNRSAAEIRHLFSKHGGSLGSVMWNFDKKGVVRSSNLKSQIDNLELELIEAGAEDIETEEEGISIISAINDLQNINKFLEKHDIKTESADIEYVPKDKNEVSEENREKVEKFIEALEENEDIADYYTNIIL